MFGSLAAHRINTFQGCAVVYAPKSAPHPLSEGQVRIEAETQKWYGGGDDRPLLGGVPVESVGHRRDSKSCRFGFDS
jgi:hypothetical protein